MRPSMKTIPRPDDWPPRGWPACPTAGRYRAAVARHLENMGRGGEESMEAMPLELADTPQDSRDESRMILADEIFRAICTQGKIVGRRKRSGLDLADTFMLAARLTTECAIGTAFVDHASKAGRADASFGIIYRDPQWAGLCPGLPETRGMEALIFWNESHEPDVIMTVPRTLLGTDPGEIAACCQGREAARHGINRILGEVFQHHGGAPHHIDLCGRTGDGMEILSGLMTAA